RQRERGAGGGGSAMRGAKKWGRGGTGGGGGKHWGRSKIVLKKVGGDRKTAALVAIEKVMAAAVPEVGHLCSRSASAARSICSLGASSPSTSRNEKTRPSLAPSRGRKLRKLSRTAPSS